MDNVTDKLETIILMALDADHENKDHGFIRKDINGNKEVCFDTGELVVRNKMNVSSAFTVDLSDGERLYSTSPRDLLDHPLEIIGNESEVMILNKNRLTWIGFRRVSKPPRGLSYLGKPACFYEKHWRIINSDGSGDYSKHFLALDKSGIFIPTKYQGFATSLLKDAGDICLAASIIEDAYRTGTMLAAVKDATEVKFPVPLADYKDIFLKRDGPMHGSRKKAIIHWVAQHIRKSTRENEFSVKKHTRGVQEFTIDGLRIRLTPNDA